MMDLFDFLQQVENKPVAGRWNYKTHDYDPYILPEGATLMALEDNDECACAQCGQLMKFGDGYTSFEIHSGMGFGYCVCQDCYDAEWKRRREAET